MRFLEIPVAIPAHNSMRRKIMLLFAGMSLLLTVINGLSAQKFISATLTHKLLGDSTFIVRSISQRLTEPFLAQDAGKMTELLFEEKYTYRQIAYLFVLDKEGACLASTAINGYPDSEIRIDNPLLPSEEFRILSLDTAKGYVYDIAAPLADGRGILRIGFFRSHIVQLVHWALAGIFGVALLTFVFAIAVAHVAVKWITKPLMVFKEFVQRIGAGDWNAQIEVTADDEIGRLAHAFNKMAADLKNSTTSIHNLNQQILAREKAEEKIRQTVRLQAAVNQLLRISLGAAPLGTILKEAIGIIVSVPGFLAEAGGAVFLVSKDNPQALVLAAHSRIAEPVQTVCARVEFGKCLCGRAASTREIQFAGRCDECHETSYEGMAAHGHYCVPILLDHKVLGVIVLYLSEGTAFDEKKAEFLRSLANMVAIIIMHKYSEEKVRAVNEELVCNESALKNMLYDLRRSHEELKNAQRRLIQSEKLASIGQLAAGIAHEINNPLAFVASNLSTLVKYIGAFSEVLKALETLKDAIETKDNEKVLQIKNQISSLQGQLDLAYVMSDIDGLLRESRDGIERIKNIIAALKTFSHTDAGTKILADLNQVLDSAVNIVWNEIKYKAELKKEYGEIPPAECNAQQLGQVFINILVNAVQAIEPRGVILLRTYRRDGNVCVEIGDTGKGMSEETLAKIFDPFFTTKEVGKGTGLGLSISYEIVKKHGGNIEVQSKVGQGTKFIVSLPAHQEQAGPENTASGNA